MSYWFLVPANFMECRLLSYGTIKSEGDLYSPKIFGAKRSFQCDCGEVSGEEFVGIPCPSCRVYVSADANQGRHRRMGKVALARPVAHPLAWHSADRDLARPDLIHEFPICPIAFRTGPDGAANSLGLKYETLVREIESARARGPDSRAPNYSGVGNSATARAICDILGIDPDDGTILYGEDNLLSLVFKAIAQLSPDLSTLVHSCHCRLDMHMRA
jgi:hypothetical protein